MSQTVELAFSNLISLSPKIIVAVAGLMLAHSRLKATHPRAYLHGNIGFSLLLLHSLWMVFGQAYLQVSAAQSQDRIASLNNASIANFINYIVLTVSLIFIAFAVFADRDLSRSSRGST